MDIVGSSETRRPGSGEIGSRGFTYHWSGMSKDACFKGVAIGLSSRLQPPVVVVIPVDERIMRLRLKHTWGFTSLAAVYTATEVSRADDKEIFYAKLDSVLDQCRCRDTLIVLGYFNAATGTERAGYELCVGPHGSGTRNTNSFLLLNFAKFRRLRIASFLYQRPELHCWTWDSNAGGRSITSSLVRVGGSSRTAGFTGVTSSLQLIRGLLLQHSSFMSSPERYQDVITMCSILRN